MRGEMRGCPVTGAMSHRFNRETHRCVCGRWERGFAPPKVPVKPRAECQICERKQATDADGTLGHHGYRRPGWGCIEGDCMGEGHKPYPATDALEKYRSLLDRYIVDHQNALANVPNLTELTHEYTTGFGKHRRDARVKVARGEESRFFLEGGVGHTIPSFAELEERESRELKFKIDQAKKERKRVVARIDKAKNIQLEAK